MDNNNLPWTDTTGAQQALPPNAESALRYAKELKIPILPLHWVEDGCCSCGNPNCKSIGKHPIASLAPSGLKSASTEEGYIRQCWAKYPKANVGGVTGADWLALDIDTAMGKGGEDSLDYLEHKHGKLPDTVVTHTGSGGRHLWFRCSGITARNSTNKLGQGLDIRGENGYVVLPPSNHVRGVYEHPLESDPFEGQAMADAPKWLIDMVTENPITHGNVISVTPQNESLVKARLPDDVRADILSTSATLDTDDRQTWLDLGMALHAEDVADGYDVWCEWSAESEKYDPKEQQRVWSSFGKDTKRAPLTLASIFKKALDAGWTRPIPEVGQFIDDRQQTKSKDTNTQLHYNLGEFDDADPYPDPKELELWRGHVLFQGSVTLVAGAPKVGKSDFILQLGLAAACGGTFLDCDFVRPQRVFWLQAEIHGAYVKQRLADARRGWNLEEQQMMRDNFFFTPRLRMAITNNDDFKAITGSVQQIKPDIIVIDPVINFSSADENSNTEINEMLHRLYALQEIAESQGAALVMLHHTRKGLTVADVQRGMGFDGIRGASAMRGCYDTGILLVRDENGHTVMATECRNGEAPPLESINKSEQGRLVSLPYEPKKLPNGSYSGLAEEDASAALAVPIQLVYQAGQDGIERGELQSKFSSTTGKGVKAAARMWRDLQNSSEITVIHLGNKEYAVHNYFRQPEETEE